LASAVVLVRPHRPLQIDERINKNLYDFPVTQSVSVETPGKTYIEIIKSESLIGKVVQGLDGGKNDKKSAGFLSKFLPAYLIDDAAQFKKDLAQFYKDVVMILKHGRVIPCRCR
jgi:hypothetical protein